MTFYNLFNDGDPATKNFTQQQCDALFQAILVHDDYYQDAKLPATIHLDYEQLQLQECYGICLQIWREGVDRKELNSLIQTIKRQKELNIEQQRSYKNIRAKFKHLRFAYRTCGETHQYPVLFNGFVSCMGEMQDAFKNQKWNVVSKYAGLLNFLLMKIPYFFIILQLQRFKPGTNESFKNYIIKELKYIQNRLSKKKISGEKFHNTRKVISRQVALYDNLKILYPSDYHQNISKYLSTINGLMGNFHDELILKSFAGTQDYVKDKFVMPEEIRGRLEEFLLIHRNSGNLES